MTKLQYHHPGKDYGRELIDSLGKHEYHDLLHIESSKEGLNSYQKTRNSIKTEEDNRLIGELRDTVNNKRLASFIEVGESIKDQIGAYLEPDKNLTKDTRLHRRGVFLSKVAKPLGSLLSMAESLVKIIIKLTNLAPESYKSRIYSTLNQESTGYIPQRIERLNSSYQNLINLGKKKKWWSF